MATIPTRRITSPFLIGLFLIIGTFAIIGVIIWLGATQLFTQNTLYSTYFDGSVEGLEKGSPVKYLGVPVGSVKSVNVAPDGKLVEIIMQIEKKLIISSNLRVKSEMTGLAGGRFLQLHYPSDSISAKNHPMLAFKPAFRLIPSSPSGMQEIERAAQDVLDKLSQFRYKAVSEEMINFLQTSTDFFNNKELYSIISNLNESSGALTNILNKADTSGIISNLTGTTQRLMIISNKLEIFSDSLNGQLQRMQLSTRIDRAFSKYDTTMGQAAQVINILGNRFEAMSFYLNEMISGFRSTSKELQRSIRRLSDDPGRELLSEPPPPEK